MAMMLPFFTGAAAAWYALRGRRQASLWAWTLTLLALAAYAARQVAGTLPLPF